MVRQVFTVVVVALVWSGQVEAQVGPDVKLMKTLGSARSLKCSFPWLASPNWDRDPPRVTGASQKDFGFQIDGIDYAKNSARIIGNAGAADLAAAAGATSVSFIERTPLGAMNLTTVYAWQDKLGRFKAVHSRHTDIGGPTPSQNYGFCEVWQ